MLSELASISWERSELGEHADNTTLMKRQVKPSLIRLGEGFLLAVGASRSGIAACWSSVGFQRPAAQPRCPSVRLAASPSELRCCPAHESTPRQTAFREPTNQLIESSFVARRQESCCGSDQLIRRLGIFASAASTIESMRSWTPCASTSNAQTQRRVSTRYTKSNI